MTTTDIISLTIKARSASFDRFSRYKKAITKRGWDPYNRNLLLYKEIQHTMTNNEDTTLFESMERNFIPLTDDFTHSESTIMSDITNLTQRSFEVIFLHYSS